MSHLEGVDRNQLVLFPEALDEYVSVDNPIRFIDAQLAITPEKETLNRKLLEQPAPFGAIWEFRFGPTNRFRVFYEVDNKKQSVQVLAFGVKERNRLFICSEEFGK